MKKQPRQSRARGNNRKGFPTTKEKEGFGFEAALTSGSTNPIADRKLSRASLPRGERSEVPESIALRNSKLGNDAKRVWWGEDEGNTTEPTRRIPVPDAQPNDDTVKMPSRHNQRKKTNVSPNARTTAGIAASGNLEQPGAFPIRGVNNISNNSIGNNSWNHSVPSRGSRNNIDDASNNARIEGDHPSLATDSCLVSAFLVEEDGNTGSELNSVPLAEATPLERTNKHRRRRMWIMIALANAVVVGVIVAVIQIVIGNRKSERTPSEPPSVFLGSGPNSIPPSTSPPTTTIAPLRWAPVGQNIQGIQNDEALGTSVAISGDGTTIVVGAYLDDQNGTDAGAVRAFSFDGDKWRQLGNDILGDGRDSLFGFSVALSADGLVLASGGYGYGFSSGYASVYHYNETGSQWQLLGNRIIGGELDTFGASVSLSGDGRILAVGAPQMDPGNDRPGFVAVYRYNGNMNSWDPLGDPLVGRNGNICFQPAYVPCDQFGAAVALSRDGSTLIAGGDFNDDGGGKDAGHARVYRFDDGEWLQIGDDIRGTLRNDRFGHSVAITDNGSHIAIGAIQAGFPGDRPGYVRVLRFDSANNTWSTVGDILRGEGANDRFGSAVSVASGPELTVAVGASLRDRNGTDSGEVTVYYYDNDEENWVQNGGGIAGSASGNRFGASVALSSRGRLIVVGGDQGPELGLGSGLAHVFLDTSKAVTPSPTAGPSIVPSMSVMPSLSFAPSLTGLPTTSEPSLSLSPSFVPTIAPTGDGIFSIPFTRPPGFFSTNGRQPRPPSGFFISGNPPFGFISPPPPPPSSQPPSQRPSSSPSTQPLDIWAQAGEALPGTVSGGQFGIAVALSGNGSVLAGGAWGFGSTGGKVRAFRRSGVGNSSAPNPAWEPLGEVALAEADGLVGLSVALSPGGDILAAGGASESNTGHIYLARRSQDGTTWIPNDFGHTGNATGDNFGVSVSLSFDGSVLVVGADQALNADPSPGYARAFLKEEGDLWMPLGQDLVGSGAGDMFGRSVALSVTGTMMVVGAPFHDGGGSNTGEARVYRLDDSRNTWQQVGGSFLGDNPGDVLGSSVAIASGNSTTCVALGAPQTQNIDRLSGLVRILCLGDDNGEEWVRLGDDLVGSSAGDAFGSSVSLSFSESDGWTVAIGSPRANFGGNNAGRVDVFSTSGGTAWDRTTEPVQGQAPGDNFGWSISLAAAGSSLASGAPFNDEGEANSGRVRVFERL